MQSKETKVQKKTKKNGGSEDIELNSEDEETCKESKGSDGDADDWIGCDCGNWYHKWCVADLNILNMEEEALKSYIFKCTECSTN